MIQFAEVTPKNWRCSLSVREDQKTSVADKTKILAWAYIYRADRPQAFFLMDGETPVGMALWMDDAKTDSYYLFQFFIDQRYQGQGYGTEALEAIQDRMRREGKYQKVTLCCVEGPACPIGFYEKCGFRRNGKDFEDEIGMERAL